MRRVFDHLLRRLVHWLRRHRYARIAERTRALEIELGMVEPTIAEMFEPVVPMTSALAELRSGHARNFFANGGDIREHVQDVLFDMVGRQHRRAPRKVSIPADPTGLTSLLNSEERMREVFSDRASTEKLITSYAAAHALIQNGAVPTDAIEATALRVTDCAAVPTHDGTAVFCLAHNQGDPKCTVYPRLTTRNSE